MRFGPVALALLCAAVAGGCGSSSGISSSHVKELVLTKADLRGEYSRFADGPTATLDTQGTTRADPERFGRQAGWVARFRRADGRRSGALVIASAADVFRSSKGARDDLRAYADDFARQTANGLGKRVVVRGLGESAVGARLSGPGGSASFVIAWVEGNATASVTASGLAEKLGVADVIALARRQEIKLGSSR
jgi:hypothetical protein